MALQPPLIHVCCHEQQQQRQHQHQHQHQHAHSEHHRRGAMARRLQSRTPLEMLRRPMSLLLFLALFTPCFLSPAMGASRRHLLQSTVQPSPSLSSWIEFQLVYQFDSATSYFQAFVDQSIISSASQTAVTRACQLPEDPSTDTAHQVLVGDAILRNRLQQMVFPVTVWFDPTLDQTDTLLTFANQSTLLSSDPDPGLWPDLFFDTYAPSVSVTVSGQSAPSPPPLQPPPPPLPPSPPPPPPPPPPPFPSPLSPPPPSPSPPPLTPPTSPSTPPPSPRPSTPPPSGPDNTDNPPPRSPAKPPAVPEAPNDSPLRPPSPLSPSVPPPTTRTPSPPPSPSDNTIVDSPPSTIPPGTSNGASLLTSSGSDNTGASASPIPIIIACVASLALVCAIAFVVYRYNRNKYKVQAHHSIMQGGELLASVTGSITGSVTRPSRYIVVQIPEDRAA